MPSDVIERVEDALAKPRDAFHATLVSSREEVRTMLNEAGRTDEDRADALALELGPFAAGRVDAGRLAAVLVEKRTLSDEAVGVVRRALDALTGMTETGRNAPFEVKVPPDGDLRDAVRDALESVGRLFGAARAAALARTGGWTPEIHEELFEGLPFRAWTTRERTVAPPLLVRVRGSDLRPAGLADFLDGTLKLVLVVDGPAPPAALARLLTPGVMVLQATTVDELLPLGDFPGPGVAALFDGAPPLDAQGGAIVPFSHDPRRGAFPWQRLEVKGELDTLRGLLTEKRWKRGWKEDLEHLLTMATAPAGTAPSEDGTSATEEAPATVTGADRLAAWLLARTDLDGA